MRKKYTKGEIDKIAEDYFLQFQAMADNLTLATESPDVTIKILKRVIDQQMARKQERATDDFLEALNSDNYLTGTCAGCKRFHFTTEDSQDYYNDGELAHYQEQMKLYPEKYVQHNIEYLDVARIDGQYFVLDCDCDALRQYERYFWNNREIIAQFFRNRAERLKHQSEKAGIIAEKVAQVVDQF
jgi:hypothetical protein